MKSMTWIILLHVILSYSAGLGEGFSDWLRSLASIGSVVTRGRRSKRSLFEFRDVITCLQPWTDVLGCYGDYGCYCGFNGNGQPLDDTDKCCYYHDKCYTEIEKESSISYASYFSTYKFQCVNNSKIICDENLNDDYVQRLCECDRQASECFLKGRRTYNERLYDIPSKYCNENPDLSDLHLGTHTLGKLYSCNMKLHDNKCCSDVGYNSEYEMCCSGKVSKRENGESSCQSFEL